MTLSTPSHTEHPILSLGQSCLPSRPFKMQLFLLGILLAIYGCAVDVRAPGSRIAGIKQTTRQDIVPR